MFLNLGTSTSVRARPWAEQNGDPPPLAGAPRMTGMPGWKALSPVSAILFLESPALTRAGSAGIGVRSVKKGSGPEDARPVVPSRLAQSIIELCARHPLDEKWLLVPNYRTGYQWLETAARGGRSFLNLHLKTPFTLALELAELPMRRSRLEFLHGLGQEVLVAEMMARGSGSASGYLPREKISPELVKAVLRSIRDLRLAGLEAEDLRPDLFENPARGGDLRSVLKDYEGALAERKLADYADVLRLAATALREDPHVLPRGITIAISAGDLERLHGLEKELWESLPPDRRTVLAEDSPKDRGKPQCDADLLAFIHRPASAPRARRDGTVDFFRALGEANEIREVIRRCRREGIPLDEVELLHTDYQTYVPAVLEILTFLFPGEAEELPVTFSEGIPVLYSRPGRALLGWMAWIEEGFPQSRLAQLIGDGLLETGEALPAGWTFSRLEALLRALPIGTGRDRYEEAFRLAEAAERRRMEQRDPIKDDPDAGARCRSERIGRIKGLRILETLCRSLLGEIPAHTEEPTQLLKAADDFLRKRVRCAGRMDEFSRSILLEGIDQLLDFLPDKDLPCFPAREWLRNLVFSSRVMGEGPRPGRLHVAPLLGGGHSGRRNVFIVGLDDGRFPPSGQQDPLLLDSERASLSAELPVSYRGAEKAVEDLSRLFARLRSKITMSYSCRDLLQDREMFPSPALVSAYRIISGDRWGTQEDLLAFLPPPVSFVAAKPEDSLHASEFLTSVLCGEPGIVEPERAVFSVFPHLCRGRFAARARASDEFTVYDGYVPEAGSDLDPSSPNGLVLSSRRLETLGRCPLEYFLRYVLEVEPPEEYRHDPFAWLDPLERGSLLHSVFRRFHVYLRENGLQPSLRRDWDMLESMVRGEVDRWSALKPPPNHTVLEEETEDLLLTARIFLQEEESSLARRTPVYFEVAVGMEAEGEGNEIDSHDPLHLTLPDGEKVRVRGRIDRVDRLDDAGDPAFLVCDYKTGSAAQYRPTDPFRQGRCIQNYLYKEMAERALRRVHPRSRVMAVEFFFPGTREHGERVVWDAETLEGGAVILKNLCVLLARGCFPLSDDLDDLRYSDYLTVFGNVETAARQAKRKMENMANHMLEPFRMVRSCKGGSS